MSMRLSTPLRLTPLALTLICLSAHAQTARDAPSKPKASAECPPERRDDCPAPADEQDRPVRNNDAAAPQVVGDAPLPAAGGVGTPAPSLRFERGALKARSYGLSLGADHALSSQWVVGALVNVAKGRIERSQTEFATTAGVTQVTPSDTTVNTRTTSLAVSLSYFTRDAIAIDGALSVMRTQLETRRVSNNTDEFTGDNVNHGYGLWLSASRILRYGPQALVPQLGLEYIDSRTDPLVATFRDLSNPGPSSPGFTVDEHRRRTLATLLSAQLQQPFSKGFGTLTPYGRVTWRQRLWKSASTVNSVNSNGFTRELDPDSADSRSSIGLATGVIAQFTHGISSFVDLSYRRGSNDLRETRLGLGLKFEI
ncbi:MAG: autotransporter outer membrane beta-barrel domain-containing protein [Rhizobacter sp.]